MLNSDVELDCLVDELLIVLDDDIAQVRLTLGRLDELRSAVIKHDEEELKCLLSQVQDEVESYRPVEAMREEKRCRLAKVLGRDAAEFNLTVLCSLLTGEKRVAVSAKQDELRGLTEELRAEHTRTTLLLRECSRLNKMLLRGIFGRGEESVTYTARGKEKWEVQNEMVNMRL